MATIVALSANPIQFQAADGKTKENGRSVFISHPPSSTSHESVGNPRRD
jgi:hypothetical protein